MALYPPQLNQTIPNPQSSPLSTGSKYRTIFLLSLALVLFNALVYYLVYRYSPARFTAWNEMAKNKNYSTKNKKATEVINYVLKGKIVEIAREKMVIAYQDKEQTFLPNVTYIAEYTVTSPFSTIEEWPLKIIEKNNIDAFHKDDEVLVLIRGEKLKEISSSSFIVYKVIKQQDKPVNKQ